MIEAIFLLSIAFLLVVISEQGRKQAFKHFTKHKDKHIEKSLIETWNYLEEFEQEEKRKR